MALSTYDSDRPDIVTVRDSLEPFWVAFSQPNVLGTSTAALRGLFADPRWDDFEQKFARVRRILEYFGELGPIHAAMPQRFAQQTILGLAQASESDFAPDGRYPRGFFPHTEDILHRAAARSTYAHPTLNFFNANSSELQNRESEACRIEANGTDPEATRETGARAVVDVRSLIRAVWREFGPNRKVPSVRSFDRMLIPGLPQANGDTSAIAAAAYVPSFQKGRVIERILCSRPALAIGGRGVPGEHRHPLAHLPAGLTEEDLTLWEPCPARTGLSVTLVALHEITHALAARFDQPFSADSSFAPALRKEYAPDPPPRRFMRTGVALLYPDRPKGHASNPALHLLNEILTEAAAIELAARMRRRLPALFASIEDLAPDGLGSSETYGRYLGVISELLPGISILDLILSEDPLGALTNAIRARLPFNAELMLETLFMSWEELMSKPSFAQNAEAFGAMVAVFTRFGTIIADDDLRKTAREKRRASRARPQKRESHS